MSVGKLATHALVFLARAVFKFFFQYPFHTISVLASYLHFRSNSIAAVDEKMFPLVWDTVEALEMYDIPVVSLTSDRAKPNRRLFRILQHQKSSQQNIHPFRKDEK